MSRNQMLLSVSEIRQITGWGRWFVDSVLRVKYEKDLQFYRIGHRLYVKRPAFMAFIESQKVTRGFGK